MCVSSLLVKTAAGQLAGTGVRVSAVIGFPSGAHPTEVKRSEAVQAVILESAVLTPEEVVASCRVAEVAGAQLVKTSTGFHPAGGAGVAAVRLMPDTVGPRLGVKASGGIRSLDAASEMIVAGATRLGLFSSATVLDGLAR